VCFLIYTTQQDVHDKKAIFWDHYVTYCCLIIGTATVKQYFYLQPFKSEGAWSSKKNDISHT